MFDYTCLSLSGVSEAIVSDFDVKYSLKIKNTVLQEGYDTRLEHNSLIQLRYKILNARSYLKSFLFFCFCFANQSFSLTLLFILILPFYVLRYYFHFEESPWGQDCS